MNDTVDKVKKIVPGFFLAQRSTIFSVANTTPTNVPMPVTVESSLGSGAWDGTTLTLGAPGLYLVGWGIKWADNNAGGRSGYVLQGSTQLAPDEGAPAPTGIGFSALGGSAVRRLGSGATLSVRVLQSSGGSLDIIGDSRSFLSVTPLMLT